MLEAKPGAGMWGESGFCILKGTLASLERTRRKETVKRALGHCANLEYRGVQAPGLQK